MHKKILIVDDNIDIVEILFETLQDLAIIQTAYNIEEAEKYLVEEEYSALILDINLNNKNGAEVVKFISQSESNLNKNTPVIIISGIITSKFIEQYKNRFSDIFIKPFDLSEFKSSINNILNKFNSGSLEIPTINENIETEPEMLYGGPFVVDSLKVEVDQVLENVKKNGKLKSLFKQVQVDRNSDNYIRSHIGLLINISVAICTKMEWNSDKTLEKFVYAAYLHDLALATRPDLARINTFAKLELIKDRLSEDEYRIVFDHPNIAARMIAGFNEIPPDVDIMIKQHHEFANETGFPTKCGFQKITPFSAVFIVAHSLTDYILENPKWKMEDFIKTHKTRLHGSHFTKIMRFLSEMK